MTSSSFYSSSILNLNISKSNSLAIPPHRISSSDTPLFKIKIQERKCSPFVSLTPVRSSSDSTIIAEAETSSNSATSADSEEAVYDETAAEAQAKIGARVRVKVPLKVYHVPKVPDLDLDGKIGFLKLYVGLHKGKKISANLPYKVEFVLENVEGRSGPVKFFAHLKEDEFEYLD